MLTRISSTNGKINQQTNFNKIHLLGWVKRERPSASNSESEAKGDGGAAEIILS